MTQETPPTTTDKPTPQPTTPAETVAAPSPPAKASKPLNVKNMWIGFFVALFVGFMVLSFVFNGSAPPGCVHDSTWRGLCVSRNDGFHLLWRTKTNGTFGG